MKYFPLLLNWQVMMCQVSVSDGQLFLKENAFNLRKANDFLDGALNAFWFSQRLVSLHWFLLLAVDFFVSSLKWALKVFLLLLRTKRWLIRSWNRSELWKARGICSAGPEPKGRWVPCKPWPRAGQRWGGIQLFAWSRSSLPRHKNILGSRGGLCTGEWAGDCVRVILPAQGDCVRVMLAAWAPLRAERGEGLLTWDCALKPQPVSGITVLPTRGPIFSSSCTHPCPFGFF